MYICKICGKELKSNLSIGGHMAGHSREGTKLIRNKVCKCIYCGKKTTINTYLPNREYICNKCKRLREKKNKKNILIHKKRIMYNGDIINEFSNYELTKLKEIMLNNKIKCEMCNQIISTNKLFCYDHKHKSDKIRGILCMHCNTIVGKYELLNNNKDDFINALVKENHNLLQFIKRPYKYFMSIRHINGKCNYCGKKIIKRKYKNKYYCSKECNNSYKEMIKEKIYKDMAVDDNFLYSQYQIDTIRDNNNVCFLCHNHINGQKCILRLGKYLFNACCCQACSLGIHEVFNNYKLIDKYLSDKRTLYDKYPNLINKLVIASH